MRRFDTGRAVALREIWHDSVWSAQPATVVGDTDDVQMFYVPIGSRWMSPRDEGGSVLRARRDRWTLGESIWEDHHVLSFAWPGVGHAVLLFFDRAWSPTTWYVNAPRPRFDTRAGLRFLIVPAAAFLGLANGGSPDASRS